MRLEIGNRVHCTDGVYGELADIVIDPLEKRVTHLVVQPEQGEGDARLVPVQLAKGRDDEQREIELECTLHEAQRYPGLDACAYPGGELDSHVTVYYDRVPKGEVEVRRASAVISADGHSLGEVDGFVVDADEHITHFVLERGHLWGRKEVTIPIGAVARVESDAVHVALSKDEVGALPAVRVGRQG